MIILESHLQLLRTLFRSYERRMSNAECTQAAVLVPFHYHNGLLSLLFTVRSQFVEHHKGEVSFPGGVRTSLDTNAIETALREAEEEVALNRSEVDILGLFDDYKTQTGYCITPVVALIQQIQTLQPQPTEVQSLFFAPASLFLTEPTMIHKSEQYQGMYRCYQYQEYRIWGATATIARDIVRFIAHHIFRPPK